MHERLQLATCAWSRPGRPYGKARTHKTLHVTRDYQVGGSIWSKENILKIWNKLLTACVTKSRKSKRRKTGKTGAKDKQQSQGTRKRAGSTKRETEVEVKARSTKRGNGSQKSNTWVASKAFGGRDTAVCDNSTRLVALTGETRLGISG